ncbi:MAG: NAD(P)H-dependent oxidoreductase [Prosthecobacter sp.]|nr:NAD(P)H-dependent oxidoreductase [Prosthecobacter sp.]
MSTRPPKILAFAGSTRTESYNKKLIHIAADAARAAGAEVTLIDLRDYPLPLFDGDLEDAQGLPENAKKLKALFNSHDALLISAPEYNSSITGVLKNTIDWVSREATDDEPALRDFKGKVATLLSASPGALGGLRSLVHVRAILGNIGVIVLPTQVSVPKAHEAFDESGKLKEERVTKQVTDAVDGLTKFLRKYLGPPNP